MTPTRMWIAEVNGRPVGFLQDWVGDYPDYAVPEDPDAVGSTTRYWRRGAGPGARVLWAWMARARRRFPGATAFFAAPDHCNPRRCACSTRPDSPGASGSTSPRRTGR